MNNEKKLGQIEFIKKKKTFIIFMIEGIESGFLKNVIYLSFWEIFFDLNVKFSSFLI